VLTEQKPWPSGTAVLIEEQLRSLAANEVNLERGYARLACLLLTFREAEGWRELNYRSWGDYMKSLQLNFNRDVRTLYAYVAVAEKLLPRVGADAMDKIGIAKGLEMVRAANRAKQHIPNALIEAALDAKTTVDHVRALACKLFNYECGADAGKYIDLGGFYADDEQLKLYKEAVKISEMYLNLPPDMHPVVKKQRIFMFWASEICGTYAAEVYGDKE